MVLLTDDAIVISDDEKEENWMSVLDSLEFWDKCVQQKTESSKRIVVIDASNVAYE